MRIWVASDSKIKERNTIMSQSAFESPSGGMSRDADIKVLVRYFWDDFTQEWSVDIMTEGLDEGQENAQVEELLDNALELVRSGDINFD